MSLLCVSWGSAPPLNPKEPQRQVTFSLSPADELDSISGIGGIFSKAETVSVAISPRKASAIVLISLSHIPPPALWEGATIHMTEQVTSAPAPQSHVPVTLMRKRSMCAAKAPLMVSVESPLQMDLPASPYSIYSKKSPLKN